MSFFAEYSLWLDRMLFGYVASNVALLAQVLEPLFVTLGTLYVIVWGFLHLSGRVDEPMMDGAKRIITLALVFACGLRMWMYNEVIVDTFFRAPGQLAAALIGSDSSASSIDGILGSGTEVAQSLLRKGNVFNNNMSYFIAGFMVYVAVGLTVVYAIFVLSLSKIALCLLLALGPGFFVLLLFSTTKRFFESWLAQLTNYALIAILIVLMAAFMLNLIRLAAAQALAMGAGIEIAHALRVSMAACLAFLVMRQVMPIAAGLASGLSLSTFGAFSSAVHWGMGRVRNTSRELFRGLHNSSSYPGATLTSKAASLASRGAISGARHVARSWQSNSIRALR